LPKAGKAFEKQKQVCPARASPEEEEKRKMMKKGASEWSSAPFAID